MNRRTDGRSWTPSLLIALVITAGAAAITTACSDPGPDAAGDNFMTGDVTEATCATPYEGCPCDEVGKLVECGKLRVQVGDEIQCTIGERVCLSTNVWSECTGDQGTRTVPAPSLGTQALAATPSKCATNACDPYCNEFADNPVGLTVPADAGIKVVDGGLTLSPTGTFTLSTCTGLTVTPKTTSELVLTTLSPTAADKLEFTATLTPAGCYPGTVTPLWTIDDTRSDALTITSSGDTGVLTAISPIAGPVTVKAHVGSLVGSVDALVNVNVAVETGYTSQAALLNVATTGTAETNSMLYPYEGTVLPLGLPAPIPQWTGTPAASAAKITLRWTKGTTYFRWSVVTAESNALQIVPGSPGVSLAAAPRYPNIPAVAWSSFERSAKGEDAEIAVQRLVGTTRRAEMKRTIRFAHSQMKGNVYYQSYGSRLTYNYGGAKDTTGGVTFPSGRFGAATLGIAPGATSPHVIAGFSPNNDTSGNNCRVCHTASADGSVLITQKFGGANGTSEMITNLTAATPTATTMTARTDGTYAWPAIFPTGGFLFGNAGVQQSHSSGPPPGGLDGSNPNITSSFWSLGAGGLGSARAATYRTGGSSPQTITVPSSSWSLEAGVPAFSSTGAKIAMQFHDGSVCPNGTLNTHCTAEEKKVGDKRSLAIMDYDATNSRLSNFRVLNTEPATACSSLHPSQACFDLWPTFLPKDTGVLYEREVFNNGSVGGGLSDFGGTRSGCDNSGVCNNDGTKAELWWTNISGASQPTRLNAANGRTSAGASYLPVGADAASYCTASGFACTAASQCCSGNCNGGRCTGTGTLTLRPVGAACTAASQCESNKCNSSSRCGCLTNADCAGSSTCNTSTNVCSSNNYVTVPAMTYVPGHNATIEPVLNYEPTMNPTPTKAADGTTDEYYWVVFTSRRMFGNIATGNPWWSDPRHQDLSKTVTTKKLWVAAMKANPTPGTDPSFAAFYLPGQEWVSGNSKAYWVNQACRPGSTAKTSANLCETTQDCCAGSTCRLDAPLTSPPTRHCITTGTCSSAGQACSTSSDCCSGFLCSNGTCSDVPPIPKYETPGVFTRDYTNPCPSAHQVRWGTFEYKGTFPPGTSMVVRARTAGKLADGGAPSFAAAPAVTIGTATATATSWSFVPTPAATVHSFLVADGSTSQDFLRIELELRPSADTTATPTLSDWRVNADCTPYE
ncbi:MAG: hypothetical protein KIT84_26675 [Labilithrix sp.]|nr:hypothetical protein [Labilithrix sp.]MCW5814639.1 hypothetical protein [Labilithrix sp.]